MTFVYNFQTGETLSFFWDPETEVFTIRQWHEDKGAPEGGAEHHVTISARMLASMAREAGLATVEYLDDEPGD